MPGRTRILKLRALPSKGTAASEADVKAAVEYMMSQGR